MQADVADPEAAQRLVEEAGELDILVNNAGIGAQGTVADNPDDEWRAIFEVNVLGIVRVTRAALDHLRASEHAAIVNVSSVVGLRGNPGQTNYVAAKAGLIGLTKALARELGSRGVRVNAVAPGYISTALTEVLPEEARATILTSTPLGRLGEPEDIAGAVRFLCSDEGAFITGVVLLVDGGLGM